jgi:hypothetical protein
MRRFAAGLMIAMFLALAGEAAAEGKADPLGLISSAVIQPHWSSGPIFGFEFTLVELTSPVFHNFDLHGVFFSATCARLISFPRPLTINDIEVFSPEEYGIFSPGLLVVALSVNDFDLVPIPVFPTTFPTTAGAQGAPLHSRGHWINFLTDHIRVVDPIGVGAAETVPQETYNPLRSAASFTNPQQLASIALTSIFLICPQSTVYGVDGIPTARGFPTPPGVVSSSTVTPNLGVLIYENEEFVFDVFIPCNCLFAYSLSNPAFGGGFYTTDPDSQPFSLVDLWYTELHAPTGAGFTGYRATVWQTTPFGSFPGGFLGGDEFGRLNNASSAAYSGGPLGGR